MMAERLAAQAMVILPPLAIICAGAWKVLVWALARHDEQAASSTEPAAAPIQQGQVINAPESWAERAAYEGARELLDDERADHARTIDRHRHCHAAMEAAGITVPDDH